MTTFANLVFCNIDWKTSRHNETARKKNLRILDSTVASIVQFMEPAVLCLSEVGQAGQGMSTIQLDEMVQVIYAAWIRKSDGSPELENARAPAYLTIWDKKRITCFAFHRIVGLVAEHPSRTAQAFVCRRSGLQPDAQAKDAVSVVNAHFAAGTEKLTDERRKQSLKKCLGTPFAILPKANATELANGLPAYDPAYGLTTLPSSYHSIGPTKGASRCILGGDMNTQPGLMSALLGTLRNDNILTATTSQTQFAEGVHKKHGDLVVCFQVDLRPTEALPNDWRLAENHDPMHDPVLVSIDWSLPLFSPAPRESLQIHMSMPNNANRFKPDDNVHSLADESGRCYRAQSDDQQDASYPKPRAETVLPPPTQPIEHKPVSSPPTEHTPVSSPRSLQTALESAQRRQLESEAASCYRAPPPDAHEDATYVIIAAFLEMANFEDHNAELAIRQALLNWPPSAAQDFMAEICQPYFIGGAPAGPYTPRDPAEIVKNWYSFAEIRRQIAHTPNADRNADGSPCHFPYEGVQACWEKYIQWFYRHERNDKQKNFTMAQCRGPAQARMRKLCGSRFAVYAIWEIGMPHLSNDAFATSVLQACIGTGHPVASSTTGLATEHSAYYQAACKILQWLQQMATSVQIHKSSPEYAIQTRQVGNVKRQSALTEQEKQDKLLLQDAKSNLKRAQKLNKEVETYKRHWHQLRDWERKLLRNYREGNLQATVQELQDKKESIRSTFRMHR